MAAPLMTFSEVRETLKQRFPMLMVDTVLALVPEKRIVTVKNVTGNEIQFLGHFPELAIMPGTLIVEAIGQSASILFSRTTGLGLQPGEFLVLALIDMRFLAPVVPGDRMEIDLHILKLAGDIALVEGVVTVSGTAVARGKLGFARRTLQKQGQPRVETIEAQD
jgi:3-hydroxyacyl-[acyl-carrier-protein] dehydratase